MHQSHLVKYRYTYGIGVIPLVPLAAGLIDFLLLDEALAGFSAAMLTNLGVPIGLGELNFYHHNYQRAVFFASIFIAPIALLHWYITANEKQFNYTGLNGFVRVLASSLFFLSLPVAIGFIPLPDSENLSRKQRAIANINSNPILYTIFIHWLFFLSLMIIGLTIRYGSILLRKKSHGNANS